jgi:hypothetical protein
MGYALMLPRRFRWNESRFANKADGLKNEEVWVLLHA